MDVERQGGVVGDSDRLLLVWGGGGDLEWGEKRASRPDQMGKEGQGPPKIRGDQAPVGLYLAALSSLPNSQLRLLSIMEGGSWICVL